MKMQAGAKKVRSACEEMIPWQTLKTRQPLSALRMRGDDPMSHLMLMYCLTYALHAQR
jgi:hypothetical protein